MDSFENILTGIFLMTLLSIVLYISSCSVSSGWKAGQYEAKDFYKGTK